MAEHTLTPVDFDPFEEKTTLTEMPEGFDPFAQHQPIPKAFVDRVQDGQNILDRIPRGAAPHTADALLAGLAGFKEGFGDQPIALGPATAEQRQRLGVGLGGLGIAIEDFGHGALDVLGRTVRGAITGVAKGAAEVTGNPKTESDVGGMLEWAWMRGDILQFSRINADRPTTATQRVLDRVTGESEVTHQPIGPLPTAEDFRNASIALQDEIPEKIQAAATRYQGKVYTGNVHYQSLEAAANDHGLSVSQFIDKVNKEAGKTEATHDLEGFITSNGRFVSREEARQIADRADQLTGMAKAEGDPLLSMEEIRTEERPGFGRPSQIQQWRRENKIIQDNLRDLWEDHGYHPAEVAHDASQDAFFRQQLSTPPYEPKDRSGIVHPQGSPVPEGTPRTTLARTGDPLVDAVLDHPAMRKVINNPVVDDTHTIPNSLGGSEPIDNPTLYRDRDFPKTLTVDGVTFDTLDPAAIHENVEEFVIDALQKSGMDQATALKVAFWHFGEVAEDAYYRAHGMDPEHVEAEYTDILNEIAARKADDIPPDLFKGTYPDSNPKKAGPGPIDKPTDAEVARGRALLEKYLEDNREAAPAGADITRPENLPPLDQQPPAPPGRLVETARDAMSRLYGLQRNIQAMLDPMSVGSKPAMVIAKDAMNMVRRIRWEHARLDAEITRRFTLEQQERMWNAADEESVAIQLGESREHQGLATLTPEERYFVEYVQGLSQRAWLHARDVGMVEGDGLPAYTPRMVLNVAAAAEHAGPQALNELGRNVFTRTAQMLRRRNMMAEETEAAAKELVTKRMTEAGSTPEEIAKAVEKVQIARNIRSLPLATARLEEAAVWKEMINRIEDTGKQAGNDTVVVGAQPGPKWFTIAGNPAFTRWEPAFARNPVNGVWEARTDDAGNVLFHPKPIYIHPDFKGPLSAILDENSNVMKAVPGAPSLYGALMTLKSKAMTAILNSPLIHNEVVWSKVAEAAGGREWLGFGLYFRGNRIVDGHPARASELIERGLNPIGPRGAIQDITAIMEEPNQPAGRSWTAKVLGAVPELFNPAAGDAVRRAVDKAGDFWHNTLLWDRVRDLQFGLADHLSDRLVAKGADRLSADRIAAHFSNIIVGSIPKEAMSAGAQATANLFLFSRSFTLGNLSTFKQAAFGLPKPILAQIERDFRITDGHGLTEEQIAAYQARVSQDAKSIARRKALATIGMSVGLYYVGNALLQHAFNIAQNGSSIDEELQGYARRYAGLMKSVGEDPFELRHLLGRLSPTYDNEPKKGDRVHMGYDRDGSAVYARNPTGKFGEELIGYPTMPMEMVNRKLSPLVSGILNILENDKGFGRKVYDENDTSVWGDVRTAFAVGKHLVMKHLPEGQIDAAVDLLNGDGDAWTNKLRVFGPALGFTASVGAPGGMARGEQLAAKQHFDAKFGIAWPDIKKQIQRGDEEGARAAFDKLGVPNKMQNALIRRANDPSVMRGRTWRDFYQHATPEEQDRMERRQ